MAALQLLRTSLGAHTRRSFTQRAAHPVFTSRQTPDSSIAPSSARRSYASKGKEREDATEAAPDDPVPKDVEAGSKDAAGSADSSTSAVDEAAAKLQAKQDEITDLTSRLRYLQADFVNLQRIAAREKEQTRDFAISRFARDLLDTVDTLAMALHSTPPSPPPPESPQTPSTPPPYFQPSSQPADALVKGVEATHRLLLQTLAKYNVKPFDPTGDKFDPNLHEALYSAPIPGKKPGEVLQCQKVGYMIKDRVLRAAQVGVAADQAKQDASTESS